MGEKTVFKHVFKTILAWLALAFSVALIVPMSPALAGTQPPLIVQPGVSQEMVEGSARYLVTEPDQEIGLQAAQAAYQAGQFQAEFAPSASGAMRDWRVWMALAFKGAASDDGVSDDGAWEDRASMRKVLGIGGTFAELPRVYLRCGDQAPTEILASQSVEGGALSARYFTYVRTQSFALEPGERCLALINLATSDNPNLGIFREGELGTRQVIAVLLKGAVTAALLIIGLILAITSYVTARPLGLYLGVAYSLVTLQNETALFASAFASDPATGREIWANVTILTVFALVNTFLFGFRDDLKLRAWWKRLLAAAALTAPAILIASASDEAPGLIWTLYAAMFLAALTVVFRLDIGRPLRVAAGAILFAGTIGVIWTEPYLGGRFLTDLSIEWFRDLFRIVSGLGVLVLMMVDIIGSRRERDRMVSERIDALETQAETDRRLLETERQYARAREAATRTKAQLAAASHDIRQPIVGLRAAVKSEADRLSPALQQRLGQAIDYLERLTREYSDQSYEAGPGGEQEVQSEGPQDAYSLRLITSAVENMFLGEAEEAGVKLVVEGSDTLTRVPALALIRATSNLVANALRHAHASEIHLAVMDNENGPVLRVFDDGIGMDAATLESVRAPGAKSNQSDGDGLGLAIVYELTQRHGLAFSLTSTPGEGTHAELALPAV